MRHALSSRIATVWMLLVLALTLPQATAAAPVSNQPVNPAYAAGEVLIGWQPGHGPVPEVRVEAGQLGPDRAGAAWQAAAVSIGRATGLPVLNAVPEHGIARLSVPVGSETAEIQRLEALPWVRYAEPNYFVHAADAAYPNDPDFSRQWNMLRTKAAGAWSLTRGSLSFVVAVLDTGVAQSHPEFAGRLLTGYNYVVNATGAEDDDYDSHGTHVSGILAANMNNRQGVAGLAPDIKLLPLKVLDSNESGRYDALAAAIYDAADYGAQVINLSLAGLGVSQGLQDAVSYAQAHGALVVAAGGNCAQSPAACGGQVNPDVYPAAYPGVLAVASSDRFDRATIYSGFKSYIGLAAPGGTSDEPIWSTVRPERGSYGALYGTSMSTPMVSAAAALVWTFRPTATANQVVDILKSLADKVGTDPYSGLPLSYTDGRNDYFGSGRLNVENAVRWAYPPSIAAETDQLGMLVGGATNSATRTIGITNLSQQPVSWQASPLPGAPWLSLSTTSGTSMYASPSALTLRADRNNLAPGLYVGVVRVQPVDPPNLPSFDIRVVLHVAGTISRAYAPLLGVGGVPAWLDPDAPGSLYHDVFSPVNDSLLSIALPFPVDFYGAPQQVVQISDNGFVIFGPANGASGRAPLECPGSAIAPNNAIYVLALDWNPPLGGQIIVHQPNADTYVITWRDVGRSSDSPGQSFQLVIGRASGFQGNYRSVESPVAGTIGAESYDAAFAQQVLCNGSGRQVKSGESVQFPARLPW